MQQPNFSALAADMRSARVEQQAEDARSIALYAVEAMADASQVADLAVSREASEAVAWLRGMDEIRPADMVVICAQLLRLVDASKHNAMRGCVPDMLAAGLHDIVGDCVPSAVRGAE